MSEAAKALAAPTGGLIKKLTEVLQAVDHVEKLGQNQSQGYMYQRATDLARAVRREMAQRNVLLVPKSWERNTELVTKSSTNREGVRTESTSRIEHLMGHFEFIDGDTGEVLEVMVPSSGFDTGDKGVFKAITGALKYTLKFVFMVPEEGDDPENEKPDYEAGKQAAEAVAERKVAAYKAKAVSSVPDKTVEMYSVTGANHKVYWCFKESAALAALKDQGLELVTKRHPETHVLYIKDDPQMWETLESVCSKIGYQLKKVTAPNGAVVSTTTVPNVNNPIIKAATIKQGKKGEYLSVDWGTINASCFHPTLWPDIQAAVGKPAELITSRNGRWYNIDGIKSIGDDSYSVIDGQYVRDLNVDKTVSDIRDGSYHATDEDLGF